MQPDQDLAAMAPDELASLVNGLQTALHRSQPLAALGQLVAGLAHELNTPLGIALTAASHVSQEVGLLASVVAHDEDAAASLDAAKEGTHLIVANLERAAALVREFRAMASNEPPPPPVPLDLGQHLNTVLDSLQPLFTAQGVVLQRSVPVGVSVNSHPGPLAQVATNLATNALNHGFPSPAPPGARLEVALTEGGREALLRFTDNGVGMTPEVQARLFEPFFTTRRGKGGMGLGMHLVQDLVTRVLGGTIEVTSAPGQGTSFLVRFPR